MKKINFILHTIDKKIVRFIITFIKLFYRVIKISNNFIILLYMEDYRKASFFIKILFSIIFIILYIILNITLHFIYLLLLLIRKEWSLFVNKIFYLLIKLLIIFLIFEWLHIRRILLMLIIYIFYFLYNNSFPNTEKRFIDNLFLYVNSFFTPIINSLDNTLDSLIMDIRTIYK